MELFEKFLVFSQKKDFLTFRKTKNSKKFFILEETEISYISGNENPKKLYHESNNKKLLCADLSNQ